MQDKAEIPLLLCKTSAEWQEWLEHHGNITASGVWLQLAKKGTGAVSVSYEEALEEALCYGWIDGQARRLNDGYYLQKFTPRRQRSAWSKRNVERTKILIAAGRMQAAGLAAIEVAKQNGQWDAAYSSSSEKEIPPELQAALKNSPKAAASFRAMNRANQYAMCFRVQTAVRPTTKQARVDKFIGMLERGETLYS
ncbi:MAG TPA: YdeI/OmpD-associated family protein [Patescibacteria group bacterium]|nr:YdeI/OmpD-associated family protein [Patescibacteria group bacterium]